MAPMVGGNCFRTRSVSAIALRDELNETSNGRSPVGLTCFVNYGLKSASHDLRIKEKVGLAAAYRG